MLTAHKTYGLNGDIVSQSLRDHCEKTAEYAGAMLSMFPYTTYFCGVGHDMGKAKKEFQVYLDTVFAQPEKSAVLRGTVNHTFAFVIWILEHSVPNPNDGIYHICQEILAYVVGAHHGLFDLYDTKGCFGLAHRLEYDRAALHYEESVTSFYQNVMPKEQLDDLFDKALSELYVFLKQMSDDDDRFVVYFNVSMLCRLLLSALVYGDRMDTMLFRFQESGKYPIDACGWKEACAFFENKLAKFQVDLPLTKENETHLNNHQLQIETNRVRQDISDQCLDASARRCGIYRLNVPTGGGKTLASFRYALHHAQLFKKKRIIIVQPRLSILHQNVEVIRNYYVQPERVLEHHSDVVNGERSTSESLSEYELLTTGWDSPVIFTTTVQFLNVLFSGQMSAVGRLAALTDSVIVLDEIQDIPRKMTYMFNQALNFLSAYCNCTVVLCSATQPSFDEVKYPLQYAASADLVQLSEDQKQLFLRTEIIDKTDAVPNGMSIDDLGLFCKDLLAGVSSLMCICNTRKQAKRLYDDLVNRDLQGTLILHISNNMCKAHINDVLNQSRVILKNITDGISEQRFVLVATQIPEAGVDVSFAVVIRCLAGLDNVVQSDGRCNRSWEYGIGRTYIVQLNADAERVQFLPDIKVRQDTMLDILRTPQYAKDLLSDETINQYYKKLFKNCDELGYPHGRHETLFGLLNNDQRRLPTSKFYLGTPFDEIGRAFRVIDNATFDIIVPYGSYKDKVKQLQQALESDRFNLRRIHGLVNDLKLCVVSVYDNQLKILQSSGVLYSYSDAGVYILDESAYSEETGLLVPSGKNDCATIFKGDVYESISK